MKLLLLAGLAATSLQSGAAMALTKANFDKEMADNKYAGVYDVDCTADGKELCEEQAVTGYPTIKWGDPSDLKPYEGGRDAASLTAFAKENLGGHCTPDTMDACSDDQKALLEGFLKRPAADLLAESKKLEKDFASRDKKIGKKLAKLKEKRQEYKDDFDEASGAKPKKGKEAEHKAKMDKLEARKTKLNNEKDALENERVALEGDMSKAGAKLMKLAARANKDKTDL